MGDDAGLSPTGRISRFIGGDSGLVDAVMAALERAMWRDDVPDVDRTISLYLQSRMPWPAFPVLASMDRLADRPELINWKDADQRRRALAIH